MIGLALQGKGIERFPLMKAIFRQVSLYLSERFKGTLKVTIRMYHYGERSLYLH